MRRAFACRVEIDRHFGLLLFTSDVIKVAPECGMAIRDSGSELEGSVFSGEVLDA